MWPRSECAREAIDAAINAVVKSKSKLAKNLLFGLRIPGKCVFEDSRVRRGQSESPCVNIVAEGHAPTLREINYSLHRVVAGRAFSILFTECGIQSSCLWRIATPEVPERRCQRRVDYLAYRFSQCSSIAFAETLKMYSPLYQRLRCCGPRTC